MVNTVDKNFSWVIEDFSLQSEKCCSVPVLISDCKWRLFAFHEGNNVDYFSLYLEAADFDSLPCGWRKYANLRVSVANKLFPELSVVKEGHGWFDASTKIWCLEELMPFFKLRSGDEGFLVDDKLIIVAQLHVRPEETVNLIECKEGKAADASGRNSQEDSSCQEVQNSASQEKVDDDVYQNVPCVDASEKGSDVDSESEEGSDDDVPEEDQINDDDDASSLVSEGGSGEKSPLNQSYSLKDGLLTVGSCGVRCNNVVSETDVSSVDYDDAPIDDVNENEQGGDNASSQRVEDGDKKCNKVASVTEASNDILKEVQPVKETSDVNGFQVLSSQVESVSHIFERHPDIALEFRPKNQEIRRAYMNELLSLIETLCQSPEKLSEDDLNNADDTLADLIDVGFKLDWLKTKLSEVSEKKKKGQSSDALLRTMQEQLQKLKLMFLDLETQLQMEKAEALVANTPLSFNDVVC